MERKTLYKAASATVDKLRSRKRDQYCGLKKDKRDRILSLKRLRFEESDEHSASFNLTVEDVVLMSRTVQKHGPETVDILRKLKKGFTQGSLVADTFIAQDGALQCLVRLLTGSEAELQSEAAWCFTNLAGTTQEHALLILQASGAYLITYLRGQNVLLQDLCAWTLGNLAGDSEESRRMIRDQGAVHPLVKLLSSTFSSVVQSAAFAICNLAQSDDETFFEELKNSGVGTILFKLFKSSSTPADIITELAWILTYFSVTSENIEYLFSCGMRVSFIVEILSRCLELPDSVQVVTPIIRTLGNMCSGPDELGEEAIRSQFLLTAMKSLLTSSSHHVRKESLWVLSNLTAGSHQIVMAVLDAGLLPVVVGTLDGSFDIRKESAVVLLNIAFKGKEYQYEIIKCKALGKFLQLLKSQDDELSFLALQFFEIMLRTLPESREVFEKLEGVAHLEALQYNRNNEICQCVNDLVVTYFEDEQEIQ